MNLKELLAKLEELRAKIPVAKNDEELRGLKFEMDRIKTAIGEARAAEQESTATTAAATKEAEQRAARPATGAAANPANPMEASFQQGTPNTTGKRSAEDEQREKIEKRAKELRSGKEVKFSPAEIRAAVTSAQTPQATDVSGSINPAFEQVGTLDQLVNITNLPGGESYKKPYLKTIGEGAITTEGSAPGTSAEPTFGYATINKVKIVAYAEVSEEVLRLPEADYEREIRIAVNKAFRRKVLSQVINGSGTGELAGIVNTSTDIMADATCLKTIATIADTTLDDIIFDYGGDEDVEGSAALIMNKQTLKTFAGLKGTNEKKKLHNIVLNGNRGIIDGIPFVLTSRLASYTAVTAGNFYLLYGILKAYELTFFGDIEVARSVDYKFKEGMIAFKVTGFVGGSVAMNNGFMKVRKASA
jgi:HK97 family phage major capsid protein